jgi:undecaprenyl-diphosphatase
MTKAALRSLAKILAGAMSRVFKELGVWLSCGLAAAVISIVFFAWLAEEVLEGDTRIFDDSVRAFVHSNASPALTSAMRFVTTLGSTLVLTAAGVCAAIIFLIAGWARSVALLAVTMVGAAALNITLKLSFGRTRPTAFFDIPLPASYSFPSGHALLSFCFYWVIAAIITAHLRSLALRVLIWAAAAILVALIGFSRIYLGVHYPSDVLAGYAAGLIWVVSMSFGDYMLRKRAGKRDSSPTR